MNRQSAGLRLGWLLGVTLGFQVGAADWVEIASGISFGEFTQPGPVRLCVARADRSVKTWTVDTMTSRGEIQGGLETVPDMVARYDDSIAADGRRYAVKAAINGDYYHMKTGVALGGQFMGGWFAKRFGEMAGLSGFVWTTDRRCFLGGSVNNNPGQQKVAFADGTSLKVQQLNEPRKADSLVLFTPQYAAHTGTAEGGVEVLVRLNSPAGFVAGDVGVTGEIVKVRDGQGSTPLLFNHVVLSAHGAAATKLHQHARLRQVVQLQLGLKDLGRLELGLPPGDWRKACASIGAAKYILVNGTVPRDWEAKAAKLAREGKKHGSVVKDPRTVIAFNDRYVFLVVIDGRSPASVGMTFTETGEFCRDVLLATHAAMQDGGGSSTLWVDGRVRNTPSGKGSDEKPGALRAVANGLFFAELLPPKQSDAFAEGQPVQFKSAGELRLGPGDTFGVAAKPAPTDRGRVLPEPLNGIYARGAYWWFCRFGEAEGWAALEEIATAR